MTNFTTLRQYGRETAPHRPPLQLSKRGLRKVMVPGRAFAHIRTHRLLKIRLYCSSRALRNCSTFCLIIGFNFSAFFSKSWNC